MEIREYVLAEDLEHAYQLLNKSKRNRILGGCTFLRSTGASVFTAIDLGNCGLDYIQEDETAVCIGAYTTFREVETSGLIMREFGDIFTLAIEHLAGVQLRNHITVGGHVYPGYGFSDFIPALLALGAKIRLYHAGCMELEDFLNNPVKRDILVEVIVPKEQRKTRIQMLKNAYSDYSVLCAVVSRGERSGYQIAVGARPGKAVLAHEVMEEMNRSGVTAETAACYAKKTAASMSFGSNFRGSGVYREHLCEVFVRRMLEEIVNDG